MIDLSRGGCVYSCDCFTIALQLLSIVLSLSPLLLVNDCRGSESSSIVLCLSAWSCSQTCRVPISLARFLKEAPIRHCLCTFRAPVSGTFHKALSDHRHFNHPVHNFRASPAMFRDQRGPYWCALDHHVGHANYRRKESRLSR